MKQIWSFEERAKKQEIISYSITVTCATAERTPFEENIGWDLAHKYRSR